MSVEGVWDVVVNSPMGQQPATITLAADGDSLTGTMAGAQGSMAISEGSADGDKATWKAQMTNPMPLTLEFSVTVDGDEMTGNVKLGAFGNASIQGKRKV